MPKKENEVRRYIIMASEGFQNSLLTAKQFKLGPKSVAVPARAALSAAPALQMQVLDSIHENGPKLVEMTAEGELSLRLSVPGVKIVPEVFYHRQWERFKIHSRPAKAKPATKASKGIRKGLKMTAKAATASAVLEIAVTDRVDSKPIKGVRVVAFTDFARRIGGEGTTGANGRVRLAGLTGKSALERIYVYAPAGYWGHFAKDTTGAKQSSISLPRVDVKDPTLLLTQLYGALPATAGAGVTVGIIDSGVDGQHPDLSNVSGGLNCVSDEVRANPAASADWRPARTEGEHGTHVAGIVGGRGAASGFRGVAPGVTLRSYRVFPDFPVGEGGASNFDIAKAIDTAIADGCDIINMSLGGGPKDDLTEAAIDRAIAAGVMVVAAAGNDDRSPVSFPAALPECVAVSAMGRIGTFPADAVGASDVAKPLGGPSNKDFFADFSNLGTEIDTTGAGVEIVSTLPGQGHGSMSGTSMACPAVAGFAAFLLSADATIRQAPAAVRCRRLKDLLYAKCKPEGFGRDFEGFGLPLP